MENVSGLLSLGVRKDPRLCLQLVPSFIPPELLAVLSSWGWLLSLENKGELDHEAWEETRRMFSLALCSWEYTSLIFRLGFVMSSCLVWKTLNHGSSGNRGIPLPGPGGKLII